MKDEKQVYAHELGRMTRWRNTVCEAYTSHDIRVGLLLEHS